MVASTITGFYDYRLVGLSILIAIGASYAAFDLAARIAASTGKARQLWLMGGAVAMGQGIWSMHYLGMLAFSLPIEVRYDLPLVLISLLAAIFASAIALFAVSRRNFSRAQILLSSVIMGSGISAMHYIGMAAMRMAAECRYNRPIVILSMVIAVVASAAALGLVFHFRQEAYKVFRLKLGAAVIMGVAICAMHYTGMAGVTYNSSSAMHRSPWDINVSTLGIAGIGASAVIILTIAIVSSLIQRKLAVHALAAAEQAALLDLALDSIIACDMDEHIVLWNQGAAEKYGWTKSEAQGCMIHDLLCTRFPKSREQVMKELLLNGHWEGELVHTCRDGTLITVMSRWVLQRDALGLPKRILEINNDITLRKRVEQELRMSEERHRSFVERAADLIGSIGPDGKLIYVNPAWKAALGYSDSDLAHLSMFDAIAPEQRQHCTQIFRRLVAGENVGPVETTFLTKDGRFLEVTGHLSAHLDNEGKFAFTHGIFRDVTKARAVARLKDEFISVVSHELRTPLTAIRGSLGLLASGMKEHLPTKGQRMLSMALTNTDRLVRLINDILDIERLQSGKIPMNRQMVSADTLMRQAVDVVQTMADKDQISIVLDTNAVAMFVDPDRIIQTFTNLLSNAIKFSTPGSEIHFSLRTQPDCFLFTVRDTGRGIPNDKLEMVFERFQQVDASDSRVKGGTGLGLAICRTIAQQHGGEIWAESVFGAGSIFYLKLPLTPPEQLASVTLSAEPDGEITSAAKVAVVQ